MTRNFFLLPTQHGKGGRAGFCVAATMLATMASCTTTRQADRSALATNAAPERPPVAAPIAPAPVAPPAATSPTAPQQPAWMNSLDTAHRAGTTSTSAYASAPFIHADSAIMIDARTGRTLFEKNADERRPVASTQKLLTALLVAERGELDQYVTTAGSDTLVEPTKLAFGPGERYTRRSLLNAMMVKSSNDAAEALGRDYAGSRAAFAEAMNRKAASLGAVNSHFVNPHGLTEPGQYSTARDMARIAFAAYRNSTLRQMMRMPAYTFQFNSGRTTTLKTTNELLKRSDVFNGMKTGYTSASGRCLVSSMSYGGRDLILVQLGSKSKYIFDDAVAMMRWGYDQVGSWGLASAQAISPAADVYH